MEKEKKGGIKEEKMIVHGKNGFKQIMVLMVVFMLIYPGVSAAKRKKHGAWIEVTKMNAQRVEGELLKVKDESLILMSNSETGITIPLNEIKTIKIRKRGKFLTGAAVGVGLSMVAGGIMGAKLKDEGMSFVGGAIVYGGIMGIPSGLVLGLLSSLTVIQKTYNFENAGPEKLSKILRKLKSKSRF
jgi:hypothetical protein